MSSRTPDDPEQSPPSAVPPVPTAPPATAPPHPVPGRVHPHAQPHAAGHPLSGAETRELAYAALEPLASPTHLFLRNAGAPLLLPRAAFHDDTSLDALLQRIDTARAAASSAAAPVAAEVDPAPPSA